MLFLLLGPSGVGKSTQIKLLKERNPSYVFPSSVTTRKMRTGESNGKPYFFISNEQFDMHISNGDFLEWAEVHKAARYGTLRAPIEKALDINKTIIKELDIQGLISIHSTIKKSGYEQIRKNLKAIFLMPPDQETLIERITKRSTIKEAELHARLESAKKEIRQCGICDFIIQTTSEDNIDEVYNKIITVIKEASLKEDS